MTTGEGLMAEYVVAVQISVQPDMQWVPQEPQTSQNNDLYVRHPQYQRAAGTYVEVEGIGEVVFDAAARQKAADDHALTPGLGEVPRGHDTWGPDDWALEATPDAKGRWTVPVSGRPVVLLAVGGGNQVFDHWEGEACRGQGARCEVQEPAGRSEVYSIDVEAKAVFLKGPETKDPRMETLEEGLSEGLANPRLRRHPPVG